MRHWLKGIAASLLLSVLAACGGDSDSPPPPPPASPASLAVAAGDEVNTIQWPAVVGAASYNLYWSETTPVEIASAEVVKGAVSPYTHTGRANGKLYYYAVTAVNANGESAISVEVGAMPVAPVPAAPAAVHTTPGDGMATLDWEAVSRADSYNVYWSRTPGIVPGAAGVTKIADILTTSYAHVSLTNLDTYYYVVTAVNTGGESVLSAETSVTPLPPAPGTPTNLIALGGDTKVQLSWSASLGATSYQVYWSTSAGVVPGAAGVTQVPGITTTSFTHTGLVNGDTYHYVVTSVGPGGESAPTEEVSATPLPPPPPAPLGVTAIAPKDLIQVTVQWFDVTDYPTAAAPIQLGYNVYRGTQPGLATYYKDVSRATKFANVTAPLVDASVVRATTYYYVVTAFVPGLPEVESVVSGEVSATTGRAGGGGGGGEGGNETSYGNNLSFPLVFADSYGITGLKVTGTWPGVGPFSTLPAFDYNSGLRPLSTETPSVFPFFDSSTAVSIGGVTYYPQGTASTWQAEWRNNATGAQMEVNVDWGDALLSRTYTTSSIVRVETTLKQDATIPGVTDSMTAYRMVLLSGTGATELRGTDMAAYDSVERNVFAINGRLTIEKIATAGGSDIVVFDKAVYEGFGTTEEEGGGTTGGGAPLATKYGAELNVAGSLVYGYNFRLGSVTGIADKRGQYRITFSLDPQATVGTDTVPNHVKMVGKSDSGATLSADGLSTSVIITVN